MDYASKEEKRAYIAIIAVVTALGILVITALVIMTIPVQEAEAGCERGLAVNQSLEKSNEKCFSRGTF